MKFFTKEWYYRYKNNEEEIQKKEYAYQKYYETIKKYVNTYLDKALCLHDNIIIGVKYFENLEIEFNPIHAFSDTKRLIFKNSCILYDDIIEMNSYCLYSELYIVQEKYELHLLFEFYVDDAPVLKQFIIQADEILFEMQFRNIGKCIKCGEIISDPTKENYANRLAKGSFIKDKWYCNEHKVK